MCVIARIRKVKKSVLTVCPGNDFQRQEEIDKHGNKKSKTDRYGGY